MEEALEDVTVIVLNADKEEVEVEALSTIAKGATSATFTFVEKLEKAPTKGVWTVNGVAFDFEDEAIVKAVLEAKSTPILAKALANEKFEDVEEDNMDIYLELVKAEELETIKTIKDVQEKIIEAGNNKAGEAEEFETIKTQIKEAKSDFARFNIIKENFERVNDEYWGIDNDGYSAKLINTDGEIKSDIETKEAAQTIIDKVNINQVAAKVDKLEEMKPSDLSEVKTKVEALVDSDDINIDGKTRTTLLAEIKVVEDARVELDKAVVAAVKDADKAMADFKAANGKETNEKYKAVLAAKEAVQETDLSNKALKDTINDGKGLIKNLTEATTALLTETDKLTKVEKFVAEITTKLGEDNEVKAGTPISIKLTGYKAAEGGVQDLYNKTIDQIVLTLGDEKRVVENVTFSKGVATIEVVFTEAIEDEKLITIGNFEGDVTVVFTEEVKITIVAGDVAKYTGTYEGTTITIALEDKYANEVTDSDFEIKRATIKGDGKIKDLAKNNAGEYVFTEISGLELNGVTLEDGTYTVTLNNEVEVEVKVVTE